MEREKWMKKQRRSKKKKGLNEKRDFLYQESEIEFD
jgi:hypothetical protein